MTQPLQFGDIKGKERLILENRKTLLLERIRKYKIGILESGKEIKEIEKKLKFLKKLIDKKD